jgi:hypothetical protein
MKTVASLIIAAAVLAPAGPALGWYAQSGSFNASRSMTGAYGHTYSSAATGSYGGGSASVNRSVTGAYGHTYNYSGSATYGGGSASVNRYASGPYGSASGSSTYTRW